MLLTDLEFTTGAAVVNLSGLTGEVRSEPISGEDGLLYVHVEFGSKEWFVQVRGLKVDIDYYIDHPNHATESIVKAMAVQCATL